MQTLYTAADVERMGAEGKTELVVKPGELISPSGLDAARSVGVEVRWASADDPTPTPDVAAGTHGDHPPDADCSCSLSGGTLDQNVQRLVSQIAQELPDADEDTIVAEALRRLGADPLRSGVGSPQQAATLDDARLPIKAKGARPIFLNDEALEWTTSIMMSLANEVWVLYERVDTLERVLAHSGSIRREDLDNYRPDEEVAAQRDGAAQEFVAKIMRVFQEARAETTMGETREGYMEVVRRAYGQIHKVGE